MRRAEAREEDEKVSDTGLLLLPTALLGPHRAGPLSPPSAACVAVTSGVQR